MKKFLAMLLLVAILASFTLALAENVKFKSNAYVYKKAGSKKTDVIIKKGSVLKKVGTKGKWTQVKYGGNTGWVRTSSTTSTTEKTTREYYAGGGGGNSKASGTAKSAKGTVKTTGKVSMRSSASLAGAYVRTVPSGKSLSYTATQKDSRGVTWYKVKYNGKTGWISSVYCK